MQKLRTVDNSKLKPFKGIGVEEFDGALASLENTKTENLNYYRKIFFENEIERFEKQANELSQKPISIDRKKNLQKEFEKVRDEFVELLDLQMNKAKDVTDMINNLKVFISQHQKQHNHNKNKKRR